MQTSENIPDKLYFKIGEVAELAGVEPYVLRYWETEFPEIKPSKSKTNQRLYKRKDVELILFIQNLLHKEKFTIKGARQHIKKIRREALEQKEDEQITLTFSEDVENKLQKQQKVLQDVIGEMDEFLS